MKDRRDTLRIEWPTLAVFAGCYAFWALVTVFHDDLGPLLLVVALAPLGALHLSLQHEASHGHPTRSRLLNEVLASLPLTLLIPFRRYKTLHLAHHHDERITDPILDPESFYIEPERWDAMTAPLRLVYTANNTLLGRLLLGPAIWATTFLADEWRALRSGDKAVRRAWLLHATGASLVLLWLEFVAGLPFWLYVIGIYPSFMLTMVRTFAEHQAAHDPAGRSVIVEHAPVLSFLFLNNNLHYLHHKHPTVAWYRLPQLFRQQRNRLLRENGGYRFAGYGEIFRAFAVTAKEPVVHPLLDSNCDARPGQKSA